MTASHALLEPGAAATEVMTRVSADAILTRGTAAMTVAAELQIRTEEDASHAADLCGAMKIAEDHLKRESERAMKPLREASSVIRAWFSARLDPIAATRKAVQERHSAWVRDREAAERARQRAEQDRAEQAAALAAEDEDEAPPPAVTQQPLAKAEPVRGGTGAILFTTKRLTFVEVVDFHELVRCAPELLEVKRAEAERLYRDARTRGELDPEKPMILHGMRFEERTITGARR